MCYQFLPPRSGTAVSSGFPRSSRVPKAPRKKKRSPPHAAADALCQRTATVGPFVCVTTDEVIHVVTDSEVKFHDT